MSDASRRIRPGNSGAKGQTVKQDFTSSSTAAVALPGRVQAAGVNQPEVYVDMYCTAACHVVFGESSVDAATNADAIFVPEMGWVSVMLLNNDTHFRCKGDSGSGSLYVWMSGD